MSESVEILLKAERPYYLPPLTEEKIHQNGKPYTVTVLPPRRLSPARSYVMPLSEWRRYQEHPAVKLYVKQGIMVEAPTGADKVAATKLDDSVGRKLVPSEPTDSLRGFTVSKAKPFVENTDDVAKLRIWRNADERASMHRVIDSRIMELEEG
jgi:hypothetical protein